MEGSKWYGLIMPKKAEKVVQKTKSIFESDDSEDESKRKDKPKQKPLQHSKGNAKKSITKKTEDIDPSIFEYDNIYDQMKATEAQKVVQPKCKEPRYIGHLLKAAEKRKKDNERRVEKKIQDERIKEGDAFADKESFVTSAYYKKMREMEEEEEREKREERLEDMMDITKQNDLSGFYRHFLKQTVGEEKVPNFGERNSKRDELENVASVPSISQQEKLPISRNDLAVKSRKRKSDVLETDKKHSELSDRKSSQDLPDPIMSENIDSDEKSSSSSGDSSDEEENINANIKPKDDGKLNIHNEEGDISENVKSKDDEKLKNMKKFEKRTVGLIFKEAQARYFRRRDASKSKH